MKHHHQYHAMPSTIDHFTHKLQMVMGFGGGGGAVGVQSLLTEDAGFLKAGPDYTTVHSECRSIAA